MASGSDTAGAQTTPGLKPKSKAARKPQQFSRMVGPLKVAIAARKRRGQANCSEKPHSEMTSEEFLEHSAKSRIMAEYPEFYTYNPDTASADLTERFNILVNDKKQALNQVYFEDCLSQDDGPVVIDVEDKAPSIPYSWVNMSYVVSNWTGLAKALDQEPSTFDCISFIKSIWFSEGYNTWDVIRAAFEQVKPTEVIRLNWKPIANVEHPSEAPTVLNQVPATCGIADGENYFHGLNPINLPSIAQFGLHPSDDGAGSSVPMLYTCKSRKTPIDIYAESCKIPLKKPGETEPVWKTFRAVLGIVSTNPIWPHHSQKVTRASADKHQYLHRPDTYEPRWVEFIPVDDEEIIIHRNEEVVNSAASSDRKRSQKALVKATAKNQLRNRKAQALITRFAELPERLLDDGPEQFVRLQPRDPPRQTPKTRNRRPKTT